MLVRFYIAALVYLPIQAVAFGVGVIAVLATPLSEYGMQLIPVVVGVSALVSLLLAWIIAPRLRARFGRSRIRPVAAALAHESQ
jgi:hypothetical protein